MPSGSAVMFLLLYICLQQAFCSPVSGKDAPLDAEAANPLSSHQPFDLNTAASRSSSITFRLFGHNFQLGPPQQPHPEDRSLFSPRPNTEEVAVAALNPGTAPWAGIFPSSTGLLSHQPLGPHVGFPIGRPPELERSNARFFTHQLFGGKTNAIPARRFNAATMIGLSYWSSNLLSDPTTLVYLFRRTEVDGREYAYLARPLQWIEFKSFFPDVVSDVEQTVPFIMYRARVGQRDFHQAGMIDIVGVEVVRPASPIIRYTEHITKVPLGTALHFIKTGG